MKSLLACAGIDGRDEALDRLVEIVDVHSPDAIVFAGGLLPTDAHLVASTDTARRTRRGALVVERFFSTLGELGVFAVVIPGPNDAPLSSFLRAGMNAELQFPGLHVVHGLVTRHQDAAFCGMGGELTRNEDTYEPEIRCSQTVANYFVRSMFDANPPRKVLLLAVPPTGALGGSKGNPVASELIDTMHPSLCVVAGPTDCRGQSRVAHTLLVNPGRLSDGSAALIDWSRGADQEVEMLDLGAAITA